MEVPNYLQHQVYQILSIETEAALQNELAATRKKFWATIYHLVPFKDGNKWCVLLGENIQEGICGFGDTPEDAIIAFEQEMKKA